MIDLHCHILPGMDDGAKTIEISMEMARMAAADGITTIACTPHILPGVYNNTGSGIRAAVAGLQKALADNGISIRLLPGADVHVAQDLGVQLQSGQALTINDSRYLLLEPPHHVMPPRLQEHMFGLQTAGYVPIITHPERLSWVDGHYDLIKRLVYSGNLVQLTAGSLTGRFGRRPRYWAERMLNDGICHLLASDGHNTAQRAPIMSEAREAVARMLGSEEAENLTETRAQGILENVAAAQLPPPVGLPVELPSIWSRIMSRVRGVGVGE